MKDTVLSINGDGTATFNISIIGNRTMIPYFGNFKIKCLLNANEYVKANKEFSDQMGLNGSINEAEEISFALIQLRHRLLETPPFWKSENGVINGGDLEDYNVITHIFNTCMEAEKQYKEMMEENYNKTKEKVEKQRQAILKQNKENETEEE